MGDKFILNDEYKQIPFVVPASYFNTFTVQKETALADECKQNPFATPATYFATLQERITDRIAETKPQTTGIRWQSIRMQLTFVASFVLLVGIGYGFFSFLQTPTPSLPPVADENTEMLRSYLSGIVDEHTLLQAAASDGHAVIDALDDEAIIRYLNNTNVSLNEIAALY
jgi:hypothetical protein